MRKEREGRKEIKFVDFGEAFYPFRDSQIQYANEYGICSKDFQLYAVGSGHVVLDFKDIERDFILMRLDRFQGKGVLNEMHTDPIVKVIVGFDGGKKHGYFRCRLSLGEVSLISENSNQGVRGADYFASFSNWKDEGSSETFKLAISVGTRDSAPHYDYGILNDIQICFER